MIKVTIAGSQGRMGSRIAAIASKDRDIEVVSCFDIGQKPEQEISRCDVLIDFTTPQATVEHIETAKKLKKAVVIGTTGFKAQDEGLIKEASRFIPIVLSPNMSMGVNLLFELCALASAVLPRDYKVKMSETHHVHKKDAPSGTAKRLAELVASAGKQRLADIPIESIREGEVVGDHKVTFYSDTETLELSHSAKSRDVFAAGALEAAKFIKGKKNGLFTMKDVLGIK